MPPGVFREGGKASGERRIFVDPEIWRRWKRSKLMQALYHIWISDAPSDLKVNDIWTSDQTPPPKKDWFRRTGPWFWLSETMPGQLDLKSLETPRSI